MDMENINLNSADDVGTDGVESNDVENDSGDINENDSDGTNNNDETNGNENNNDGTNDNNEKAPKTVFLNAFDDDDVFDPAKYLTNYNEAHKDDQPILFRDTVIQQTLSCLISKYKPNALLTGPAGVGKTKIVEEIARLITADDPLIPDQIRGYTVWELPLSNIVSGSSLVGELERKTKNVLQYAANPENKAILFIDEIHVLMDGNQAYDKIAQIMKSALARGNIRVIGATTTQEVQLFMRDPAFNRRFTRIIVDELSREQTRGILERLAEPMFEHYNRRIAVTDKVIDDIINVSDEYKTIGSHRPDSAITLLDRAMADAYIRRQREEYAASDDTIPADIQEEPPVTVLSVTQMRETAMKLMTGSSEKVEPDMAEFRRELEPVKGQDDILEYLLDTIERENLGLNFDNDKRPLTFLFAGNSGVGKSEVAKIIAKELTGSKPIILNMTEYNNPSSINRIIGAPAGYVGSDSKAELPFDILDSNPYQVILLDEFEKSDKAVQRLFMSAFDEGFIKTSKGKTVDFSRTMIIATTNAGHTGKSNALGFTANETGSNKASVTDLSKFFDVELLNRFTKILNFNAVTESLFREILVDTYRRHTAKVKAERSDYSFLPDEPDEETVERLVKENFVREFGARPIKRVVKRHIEDIVLEHKRKATAGAL